MTGNKSQDPGRGSIALASGNHLCSNPRVFKEAEALSAAGFRVHVLGGAYETDLKKRDLQLAAGREWIYTIAYDLTQDPRLRFIFKLQRRVGLLLWSKLGVANRWQIFYGTGRLKRVVNRLDADLTIAHWEAALPAVVAQANRGKRVGIDMEDWFSEDLLPSARASRPIGLLAGYEKLLLCRSLHSTCTSEAMASALVDRYGCRRPLAIRNVFPSRERATIDGAWKDRPELAEAPGKRSANGPVSIHWYSQTIGPGRGLEELMAAARTLSGDFEIHLRGESGKYQQWLTGLAAEPMRNRLFVHSPVHNDELLSRIAEHDIGFAGEQPNPPSRNLTITNKLFQYLQGGLAVVASDTSGQREAAQDAAGAVALYKSGDVDSLRSALQRLINNRDELRKMRSAAWDTGARLCWENEAPKLVGSVTQAIGARQQERNYE